MVQEAVRPRRGGRRILVALLALALSLSGGQAAIAQEASGDVEITIVVHPGESPSGNVDPGSPGTNQPGAGQPAGSRWFQFGTISSQIVFFPAPSSSERQAEVFAFIVVSDERGTGAGWDIGMFLVHDAGQVPVSLVENRTSSIRRILPADGRYSEQIDLVRSGQTLGMPAPPIPLLHAAPGGGSGVYLQELLFQTSGSGSGEPPRTIVIQLPFAP